MAKKLHPVTNIRLVKEQNGRIDGGKYTKPVYAVLFDRNKSACKSRVAHNGERRPLGQDVIDAMKVYIDRGETTEAACLDCRIID